MGKSSGDGSRWGVLTSSEKHAEILEGLLDGIAIVRQSDGALVYANPALSALLDCEPHELERAVAELVRSGHTSAVELAHPELGLIRLVVVPRDPARPAERTWHHDLRRELARAQRRGWPLTLAAIALDAGGRTQAAAVAWSQSLRAEDSLTPYEDGAYLVILPDCPADAAPGVARRLREATPPPATVSMGFATASAGEELESLVARAVAALADARAAGSNQFTLAPASATAAQPER